MSFNKVILQGRLGADPNIKTVNDTTSVCALSVATTRVITDRNGGKQEITDWHAVSVWGKQALACHDRLHKGSNVLIEGAIRYTEYQDNQGVTRKKTEIVASSVVFLDPAQGGQTNRPSNPPQTAPQSPQGGGWGNYAPKPQNSPQNGWNQGEGWVQDNPAKDVPW